MSVINDGDIAYLTIELGELMLEHELVAWTVIEHDTNVFVNVPSHAFEAWRRALKAPNAQRRTSRWSTRYTAAAQTNGGVGLLLMATDYTAADPSARETA